jgi:hypothetical protein
MQFVNAHKNLLPIILSLVFIIRPCYKIRHSEVVVKSHKSWEVAVLYTLQSEYILTFK